MANVWFPYANICFGENDLNTINTLWKDCPVPRRRAWREQEAKKSGEKRSQTGTGKRDTRWHGLLEVGGAVGSVRPKFGNLLEARGMGRFANEEWKPARKMWPPKGKWLGKKGLINSSSEESGGG